MGHHNPQVDRLFGPIAELLVECRERRLLYQSLLGAGESLRGQPLEHLPGHSADVVRRRRWLDHGFERAEQQVVAPRVTFGVAVVGQQRDFR